MLPPIRKYRRLFFLDILFIAILMFAVTNHAFLNKYIVSSSSVKTYLFLYFLRVGFLMHAIYCTIKWMYFLLIKNEKSVERQGLKLTLFATTIFFLLAEAIFMLIPQSQGNTQFGLGDVVWNIFYSQHRNEKRYRDENIEGRINNGKKKVFFLGDSFTYGSGIKNSTDRFSNIISKGIVSSGYEVFNLGKGNSDTREEFVRLMQYGSVPDLLVLQYYFNDIDPSVQRLERKEIPKTDAVSIVFKTGVFIAQTSFFLNFVAVNLAKFTTPFQSGDFKKKMASAYHNNAIMKEHLADLQSIINFCILNKTKLYVLLIPDLRQPDFTEKQCYQPIITYLEEQKVTYVDIYNEIKEKPIEDLVVSSVDAHANERVQHIIAKKLMQIVPEFNK